MKLAKKNGSLGLQLLPVADNVGARVESIKPDSAASECKQVFVNDVLLAIDGVDVRAMPTRNIFDLLRRVGDKPFELLFGGLPANQQMLSFVDSA